MYYRGQKRIEMVQSRAARYVVNRYHNTSSEGVTIQNWLFLSSDGQDITFLWKEAHLSSFFPFSQFIQVILKSYTRTIHRCFHNIRYEVEPTHIKHVQESKQHHELIKTKPKYQKFKHKWFAFLHMFDMCWFHFISDVMETPMYCAVVNSSNW
jgi:hypothetical protein